MVMKMKQLMLMTLALVSAIAFGNPPGEPAPAPDATPVVNLSPKLRQTLIEEMRAMQGAMAQLAQAIPQGRWQVVHETAFKVHDSFIMKQALSAEDRQALQRTLPETFVQLDAAFHQQALRLAIAAHNQDAVLTAFWFGRMTESCLTCHAHYARHRFPALTPPASHGHVE